MKGLFAAAAAVALLAAPVAQATDPLPGSVTSFIDYICELEDNYVIPPPAGGAEEVIVTAFDAYVEAGLLDGGQIIDYAEWACDTCFKD